MPSAAHRDARLRERFFGQAFSGAEGIRTPDLISAIDARSQLRYSPAHRSKYNPKRPGCQISQSGVYSIFLHLIWKSLNNFINLLILCQHYSMIYANLGQLFFWNCLCVLFLCG